MNILNMVLENKELVNQVSQQFGLSQQQTEASIKPLAQNIAGALKQNTQQQSGMDSFLQALAKGDHSRYAENPQALSEESAKTEGNAILGHLFGSKDASRQVAQQASAQSGVSNDILKQILPLIASATMGKVSQQANNQGLMGNISNLLGGGSSNELSGLTALLDTDNDGSVVDDALGFAGKLFGTK